VLVAACALVMDLQTIVSRGLSPTDVGVVSVTEPLTDGTRNVLPGLARIEASWPRAGPTRCGRSIPTSASILS